MVDAIAAIEEFTELAVMRSRGQLPLQERPRLEALEDILKVGLGRP